MEGKIDIAKKIEKCLRFVCVSRRIVMAVVYYIDKYTERKAYIVKVPEIRMCNLRRAIDVEYYI